jgi:SOS response regulatory protein OraA/RecX
MQKDNDVLVFLDAYLKKGYVTDAIERLKAHGLIHNSQYLRDVKRGRIENWKVLEILAELALENKIAKENVQQIINNN